LHGVATANRRSYYFGGGKVKCDKCGEVFIDDVHGHAGECPRCHYYEDDNQGKEFRAFRRQVFLEIVGGLSAHLTVSTREISDKADILWKTADRIARAEPKE
jgi:hypothetical protein